MAAREIEFHPEVTVIKGENSTGKSSLLKTLYWTFGAEPETIHARWKQANIVSLVEFKIDAERFFILRSGGRFGLFDGGGALMLSTSSVTKELGPRLAQLLDFELVLTDAKGNVATPPPAFCFLPYYIDQDNGWTQPWRSFARLGQFPRSRQDIIYYHSGIRPNEFYRLKTEISERRLKRSEHLNERSAVESTFRKIRDAHELPSISFDEKEYAEQISRLLAEMEALQADRREQTAKISDLASRKAVLDEQVTIAKAALGELDKDYVWIRDELNEEIVCPTCGSVHENSFANRFSLIEDRETCRGFLLDASQALDDLKQDIAARRTKLGATDERTAKIKKLLDQKQGELRLRDVIEAEGNKRAIQLIGDEIDRLNDQIALLDGSIADLERKLKSITSADHKRYIENFYADKMAQYLRRLNINNLDPASVSKIDASIKDTGSDQPRAVLAYNYAFLHTASKFSSSAFCPIVIDSPNQQDQDTKNVEALMNLIFDERPSDAQLIVGTVSLHGVRARGKLVELVDEGQVLSKSEFHKASATTAPFFDKIT